MALSRIYRTLQEGEIRVLELQPHFGDEESPLRGTFCYCSLDVEPIINYETISWYWGDPTPTSSILLGDETLCIPENAWRVLRRVRYSNTVRRLWIDAVCINQPDLVERSKQVEMMSEVYRCGASNIVYLGEVHGDAAKEVVEMIENRYGEALENERDIAAPERLCTPGIQEALLDLVSRSWFT